MIIQISDLTYGYGKNIIYQDAHLEIKEPGIYGLIGPNGSGKTTLLQLIVGLLPLQKGEILINGHPEVHMDMISFVQDQSVLYPYLSGIEHFKFICQQRNIPKTAVEQIAEKLEMTDYLDKKTKTYSLGMKQRLLLGMGLIKETPILLLDEPLNGLDPVSTMIVREALLEASTSGKTILVSSHHLSELERMTREMFFVRDQKILYEEMDLHQEAYVNITVYSEDKERAVNLLVEKNISYTQLGRSFEISMQDFELNDLLSLFLTQEIKLVQINTEQMGVEQLYRHVYEGR